MSLWTVSYLALILFFTTATSVTSANNPLSPQKPCVEQGFIAHPEKGQNRVEFFFLKPTTEGPFPILFLPVANHPKGASVLVEFGYLDLSAKELLA